MKGKKITEKQFQRQVEDLAHIYHWKIAHFRPAMTKHGWRTAVSGDGFGFPDNFIIHPQTGRLIIAELKSQDGRLSPAQKDWLDWCRAVPGIEVYVWRPDDIDDIVNILRDKGQEL